MALTVEEFSQLVQSSLFSGFPDGLALSLSPVPELGNPDARLSVIEPESALFPSPFLARSPSLHQPIPLPSRSFHTATNKRPRQMFDKIRKHASSLVSTRSTTPIAVRDNAGSPTKEHFHPIPSVSLLGSHPEDDAESDFIPYLPLAVQYERALSRPPQRSTSPASVDSRSTTPAASPSTSSDERRSLDSDSTVTEPHSPATPRTPQFLTPPSSAHLNEDTPSIVSVATSSHSDLLSQWPMPPSNNLPIPEDDPFAKGSVQIIDYYSPRHPFAIATPAGPSGITTPLQAQAVKRTHFSSPRHNRTRHKDHSKERRKTVDPPSLPPPSSPLPEVPGSRTSINSENGGSVSDASSCSESACEWTLRLAVSDSDPGRGRGLGPRPNAKSRTNANSKTASIILDPGDTETEKETSVENEDDAPAPRSSSRGRNPNLTSASSPAMLQVPVPVLDSYTRSSPSSSTPGSNLPVKHPKVEGPPDWTLSLPILTITIPSNLPASAQAQQADGAPTPWVRPNSGSNEKKTTATGSKVETLVQNTPTLLPSTNIVTHHIRPNLSAPTTPTPALLPPFFSSSPTSPKPKAILLPLSINPISSDQQLLRPPPFNYIRPIHRSDPTFNSRPSLPPAPLRCVPMSRPPRADTRRVVFRDLALPSPRIGTVSRERDSDDESVDSGICMDIAAASSKKGCASPRTRTNSEGSLWVKEREGKSVRKRKERAPWDLTGNRGAPVLQPTPVLFWPSKAKGKDVQAKKDAEEVSMLELEMSEDEEVVERQQEEEVQEARGEEVQMTMQRQEEDNRVRVLGDEEDLEITSSLSRTPPPAHSQVQSHIQTATRTSTPEQDLLHKDEIRHSGQLSLEDLEKACAVLRDEHRRSMADQEGMERMAREVRRMVDVATAEATGRVVRRGSVDTLREVSDGVPAASDGADVQRRELRRSRTEETLNTYWSYSSDEEDVDEEGGSDSLREVLPHSHPHLNGREGRQRGYYESEEEYGTGTSESEGMAYYSARSSLSWTPRNTPIGMAF